MSKVISCASYYGSGSSAVIDYLGEFEGVKSLTNYEFRFLQDPDGVSELEYNLCENFNRHNSGHALKRYKKLVDYYGNHLLVKRYEPFFDNKWKEISYDYIDSLVDFSHPGIWQYDFYDKGPWYEFWHKLPDRLLHKTFWKNKPDKHFFFDRSVTYGAHPTEDKFLKCTRKYTSRLFNAANKEKAPYLLLDQLIPSTNIKRHMRYLDNIKVFVVDRDPRDVYLLSKYVWKDGMVPSDLALFCKWFEYARSQKDIENSDPENILFLKFEDLIYKYDETTEKIREWVGISECNHKNKFKYLDPSKSIKNTRYWISHPEYTDEANYIAEHLKEYLYDYDDINME